MKILLVEDDPMTAMLVKTVLAAQPDIVVAHVVTGHDALDAVCSEATDIILLDHNLPDGNGNHFATELRKLAGESVKILSFSASSEKLADTINQGKLFDGQIPKPFNAQQLAAQLRSYGQE